MSRITSALHPVVGAPTRALSGDLSATFGVGSLPGSPPNHVDGGQKGVNVGFVIEEADRGTNRATSFTFAEKSLAVNVRTEPSVANRDSEFLAEYRGGEHVRDPVDVERDDADSVFEFGWTVERDAAHRSEPVDHSVKEF